MIFIPFMFGGKTQFGLTPINGQVSEDSDLDKTENGRFFAAVFEMKQRKSDAVCRRADRLV